MPSNLTPGETQDLARLQKHMDIVIKAPDKGSNIVLVSNLLI